MTSIMVLAGSEPLQLHSCHILCIGTALHNSQRLRHVMQASYSYVFAGPFFVYKFVNKFLTGNSLIE